MHLSDAIEGFLLFKAVRCSEHTIADYRNTLEQWLDFLDSDPLVMALTPHDVNRFLYYLKMNRGLAPKTVKNAHTAISSFFTWAQRELGCEHVVREGNVRAPAVTPPEIVPLTQQEIKLLLDACNWNASWETKRRRSTASRRPTRFRDRAIMLFLLDTGVRASELCDLRIGDVDLKGAGTVMIRNGKGGKGRVVYIGTLTREALWRYLSRRKFKEKEDPLFATYRRGPLDRHALRKMLKRAGKRAGISEPVYPHRLRHTFAISYLRNGGDIYTLQKMLGHSSLDMVKRYLQIAQTDVAEAHRRASPVDNWRLG